MKITYTPTLEEFTKFTLELSRTSGEFAQICRRKRLILSLCFIVIALGYYSLGFTLATLVTLLLGALLIGFYPAILRNGMRRGYKRYFDRPENQKLFMEKTINFTSKNIQILKEGVKSEISWKNLEKVLEHDHHYILVFKGTDGLYIPKSALTKSDEKELKTLLKPYPLEKI